MKVRYAHLCDYMLISKDNKPTLAGIYNRVWGKAFPFTLDQPSVVVVCLKLESEDPGQTRTILIAMTDPEGRDLFQLHGEIQIDPKQSQDDVFLSWTFDGLQFAEPGPHILRVLIGGQLAWEIDLLVQLRS